MEESDRKTVYTDGNPGYAFFYDSVADGRAVVYTLNNSTTWSDVYDAMDAETEARKRCAREKREEGFLRVIIPDNLRETVLEDVTQLLNPSRYRSYISAMRSMSRKNNKNGSPA